MKLRTLPAALLALLLLASALPAAAPTATAAGLATVCVGEGPGACVHTGPCYGASVLTGATDIYPGAAVCKLPPGDHTFCGRAYAGVGTFGGFYGPNALVCAGGDAFAACVGLLGNWLDPVCL